MHNFRVVVLMISGACLAGTKDQTHRVFIDFAKLNFMSMIKSSQAQGTDVLDVDVWKIPPQYICKLRTFLWT